MKRSGEKEKTGDSVILTNHMGYTLIELTVVMFVIAILAGVVLTGARGLLHRQRFSDAQEHFRSMVLTARNRSQTKTNGASTVGVHIPVSVLNGVPGTITLFEDRDPKNDIFLAPPDTVIDTLPINAKDFSVTVFREENNQCSGDARILFNSNNESATLYCDLVNANILKINFRSAVIDSNLKQFTILKESGILQ